MDTFQAKVKRKAIDDEIIRRGSRILKSGIFKRAMKQTHHHVTTVGSHSLRVTRISLHICNLLKKVHISADRDIVVRAALCHDLGIVGRDERFANDFICCFLHPIDSAKIAKNFFPDMDNHLRYAISRHMWPQTILPPLSLEGFIVSTADKCASFQDLSRWRRDEREMKVVEVANWSAAGGRGEEKEAPAQGA